MQLLAVFALISAALAASSTDHPPHMYEANCPPKPCLCPNQTTIVCEKTNFTNTDIFLQVKDQFYPELDTLVITGNVFTDLEPINLFGPNVKHEKLSKLVLSNNRIQTLNADAFRALSNVEELDLSFNDVNTINGDLFQNMSRLKILKLSNFFDVELNFTARIALLKTLFSSTSHFTELDYVDLSLNSLAYLPSDLWCALPALQELSLRDNNIGNFKIQPDCIQTLLSLDLRNNEIGWLGTDFQNMINSAEHLHQVDLSRNPFVCNCELKEFVVWFNNSRRTVKNDKVACLDANPAQYEDVALTKIDATKLQCDSDGGAYIHTVYVFITLSLIGLCLIMACVLYCNRTAIRKLAKKRSSGNARYRFMGGYEKLEREPEVNPEFV